MEEKNKLSKEMVEIFLKNIAIFLLTVIIVFLLAELIVRLFYDEGQNYRQGIWDDLRSAADQEIKIADSSKHYINEKNGLIYRLADDRFEENEFGSFDRAKITKEKDRNKYRVVVLGDSFTAGNGVGREEDKYVNQLAKILKEGDFFKKLGYSEIEILPFGGAGINSVQELVVLKEMAINYNPDLIILQYCDNDVGPMLSPLDYNKEQFYISSKTKFLLLGNRIVPSLPYLSKNINWFLLKNSAFFRFVSYKLNIILVNSKNGILYASTKPSFDAVTEMNKIAKENGAKFLIMNFVPAELDQNYCEYVKGFGGKKLHEALRQLAQELGVPFYNMCDYVENIQRIKSRIEPEIYSMHYNEEGYRIAAGVLAKAVEEIMLKK